MARITVVFLVLLAWLGTAFSQQQSTLYWSIKDDALFPSQYTLKGPSGSTVVTLPGRSLVALSEAKRRIGEQLGLHPKLVISNQPGINAFATETAQGALVAINADTVAALGDNADMWAALLGHEFSHVYHHHVADHKLRASLIGLVATVLDTYQKQQGKDQTELINFGATLLDNAFTRDQERQADATSIEYMVKAGYNPDGAIQLQRLFLSKYGSSGALSFLQSHPAGEERIQLLRQKIATNATPRGVPVLSTTEFNRWLSLCGSETRDKGIERNQSFASTFACLHKQNPETAKRYALCAVELEGRGQMNQSALANCAANGYNPSEFGYLPWGTYCTQIARQQNYSPEVALVQINRCVWANAEPVALRGYLCEVDAAQTRVPVEERAAFLRGCTADTTDLKVKFAFREWELACKRKGSTTANLADEQAAIERVCLAQGPEAPKGQTGNNKSTLTPQQILAEVSTALNKLKPQLAVALNECDRLASTESFEGVAKSANGDPAQFTQVEEAVRGLTPADREVLADAIQKATLKPTFIEQTAPVGAAADWYGSFKSKKVIDKWVSSAFVSDVAPAFEGRPRSEFNDTAIESTNANAWFADAKARQLDLLQKIDTAKKLAQKDAEIAVANSTAASEREAKEAVISAVEKQARQLPVELKVRRALVGGTLVLTMSTSQQMTVHLEVARALQRFSKDYQLVPGRPTQVGHLEGWGFLSGDSIKLSNPAFDPKLVTVP